MSEMTFYIDGPSDNGEGVYHLVAETGEHLGSHVCSNVSFARFDLVDRRKAQQAEWRERFGGYRVVFIGDDATTREELHARNKEWAERAASAEGERSEPR